MCPTNQELMERRHRAVPRGPFNVTKSFAAKARGGRIIDVEGREYIDFAGGIGVMGLAHSHPRVLEAMRTQLDAFVHTCFHVVPYEGYVRVCEELNSRTPGMFAKRSILLNSGAEAVENAIKVARAATGRPAVLCFTHGFHGRTLMGMSLTSKIMPYKKGFGPFASEVYRSQFAYCYRCPFGASGSNSCDMECAKNVEEMLRISVDGESVAAVVFEPIQGEGGFIVPPQAFVEQLREITKRHGIVLVADEVQTGLGRTGKLFASEHFHLEPDLITTAKALACGMPLAALTGRATLMEAPQIGGLGGTFGGNPVSCAAALATFEVIDEQGVLERGREVGAVIRDRFDTFRDRFELVGDVRGIGAMMAMELVTSRQTKKPATAETKALNEFAYSNGLITITAGTYGNVVRLLPPLLMDDEDLRRGLDILEAGLEAVTS